MPTVPPLFYVSPEWDKLGRLTRHSLVWNALDGPHTEERSWYQALVNRRPLASRWTPPVAMLERGERDADFLAACDLTFAVKPAAWEAIKDLVGDAAEALPVAVTRMIDPAKFGFPAIPAAAQPSYLLLHGLFNVPFHGQSGYWDVAKNRYDMSMGAFEGLSPERCKLPWLDPTEFAGKHLFLLDDDWVASAVFVERVMERRLTGLVFHPIKYEPKPRPVAPRLKKTMPGLPRPDFALAARGFSPKLGKQWLALWDWLVASLKNRGWHVRKPQLKAPLAAAKLLAFEDKHGIKVPRDYPHVLATLASAVTINLGHVEPGDPGYPSWEEIQARIRDLMFGGEMDLWSFDVSAKEYVGVKKWGDELAMLAAEQTLDDEYYQHFRNKLPILRIGNGDYIALDLKTGVPTYISHEGDDQIHGKPLGKNFADFITRWSWTCLPWPDFLPSSDFYDQRSARLPEASSILACWHAWLRGAPLPPE